MPRRAEYRQLLPLAVLALAATLVLVAAGGRSAVDLSAPRAPGTDWAGLVGGSRPRVSVGQRMIVLLNAPSLADRVAAAGGRVGSEQERLWTQTALASQKLLISRLGIEGVQIVPEFSYARVVNGFSAPLDARAIGLLEQAPEVRGLYPVRAAFPATTGSQALNSQDFLAGMGHRPDVAIPGSDGRGVTIALLDTGVDRAQPFLRGRITGGADVVGLDPQALAAANPGDSSQLERHGTELAGLLVGAGGPFGLSGVAPGASVLPIRVGGWQRDALGSWSVYGRTDQLIEGLERAVDPNGDGDAHDAARVALVGLAEPYAAFADGPLARAAAGALALDTLVVAPAGNDGQAGPSFGSISGPGGAPAALTVGAVDLRTRSVSVRIALHAGLALVFNQRAPLEGDVVPDQTLNLRVVRPRPAQGAPTLAAFFDQHGYSIVAGRAALVSAGGDPRAAVEAAVRAGASAVLVYGTGLPSGALGLDERVPVPVVGIPERAARALLGRASEAAPATVSIGGPRDEPNLGSGRVADFSSQGLSFDGQVKPDLVAAGVGMTTAEPSELQDGVAHYGTVNGSSASAALVAGAAALLAQARPDLDAAALRGLLVGSATPLPDDLPTAQGAGMVNAEGAAATEIAADPATLALGRATGAGWKTATALLVRNVSTRPLHARIAIVRSGAGAAALSLTATPAHFTVLRGGSARVTLVARVLSPPVGNAPSEGAVVVAAGNSLPIRVPFAVAYGAPPSALISALHLSTPSFLPSDTAPALLTLQVGSVGQSAGRLQVVPVAELEIQLWDASGRKLGVLARERDLLPGRLAFALTGRDPSGGQLPPGRYRLRLLGFPTLPGPVSRAGISFVIR